MLGQQLLNDGYLIVRDVLSKEEIRSLKESANKYFLSLKKDRLRHVRYSDLGQFISNLSQFDEFNWVFYHPKIVGILNEILGENNIFINLDSSLLRNRLSGWHRDTGSAKFRDYSWEKRECQVYQVGLYLEDHPAYENRFHGLRVKKGSHLDTSSEEIVHLDIKAGDLAFWDIRTVHAGPVPDNKERKIARVFNNKFYNKVNSLPACYAKDLYWKLAGLKDRYLLSFSVGSKNDFTRKYAELMLVKHFKKANVELSADFREKMRNAKVDFLLSEEDGAYEINHNRIVSPSGKITEVML